MRIQILILWFAHDLLYAGFTALISRTTADLTWRSYVGANHTELPRLVPKFPLFRLTLIRVLWVKPTRVGKLLVPSVPVSNFLIWTCWNLMHCSTGHVASFPPFYSYKKDKDVKHEHYSGEIMFTKNECIWISSQWALWRETFGVVVYL